MVTCTAKCIVLWGWLFLVSPSLCSFSPPYSNQSYSCRCIPCFNGQLLRADGASADFHAKMCELRSYARDLDKHVSFMGSAIQGDNTTVLEWFNTVEATLRKKLGVKDSASGLARYRNLYVWVHDVQREISQTGNKKHTPFDVVRQKDALGWTCDVFKTKAFARAWKQVLKTGSFDAAMACWKALIAFVQEDDKRQFETLFKEDIAACDHKLIEEKEITVAFVGTKDISMMVYLMHAYFISCCKEYCATDARLDTQAIMNLIELYNAINALPIERTIQEIVDLIKDFMDTLETLNQNAEDHFVGWLKNKWVYLPLAVGVMIVRIVQCFGVQKTTSANHFWM